MTSESSEQNVNNNPNENEIDRELPSFLWLESELLEYLAQAWDQQDPLHIKVIGRLQQADKGSFGFLEDLHHPETGIRLFYPLKGSKVNPNVFVPPDELTAFQKQWENETYALAELDLSPLQKRKDRDDPFACIVRTSTLEPLSHIPESWWKIHNIQSDPMPIVLAKARKAIEDLLRRETSEAEDELRVLRSALESAVLEKNSLNDECKQIDIEVRQQVKRIAALEAEFVQRRNELEKKFRELELFLKESGKRMVALDLVDSSDLEKLFPPINTQDAREGHSFQKALSGDFQSLASYIQAHLWRKGIHYTRAQLLDYFTLLRTNDLIVLAGDSGSGKTSLVKSVASAIGARCTVVPVKPNWTGSEDLLGYYNPIEQRYQPSQFLVALLDAAREPEIPHFICLDEMNLARVEYYFADFLSLLETRGEAPWIHLYSTSEERQAITDNKIFLALEEEARKRAGLTEDASFQDILMNDQANLELRRLAGFQEADTVLNHHAKIRRSISTLIDTPAGFRFPQNVWIVGAINVDETTHYLSPKILDRAHIMRFRNPVLMDWEKVEQELREFNLDLDLPVRMLAAEIGARSEYPKLDQTDPHVKLLIRLARDYLDPLGIEFGLRAIRQSLNYIQKGKEAQISALEALNNVVLHKILPKIILDVEKPSTNGRKRYDLLIDFRDELEKTLDGLDETKVNESAIKSLDDLIARSEVNNGIANFWAR
ncbi:McrB family protein [Vreelandella aquamarina]|uniref:McrB family protein n=1 Tax=Vreelandella aquamarina TaxID=77097 RepID=UPI001C2C2F97|nr:AAA family ATPase [Halomonas meridiana]